jgi:hypothetical protein
MDDAKRDLVRAWLIKARNDLDTARQIGRLPDGHLDTAIYHCQQAAEKGIKGVVVEAGGFLGGGERRKIGPTRVIGREKLFFAMEDRRIGIAGVIGVPKAAGDGIDCDGVTEGEVRVVEKLRISKPAWSVQRGETLIGKNMWRADVVWTALASPHAGADVNLAQSIPFHRRHVGRGIEEGDEVIPFGAGGAFAQVVHGHQGAQLLGGGGGK